MPLRVIIVGAGIAGLCAAVSMRRAGWEVVIFEKSAFAAETGAALAVSPNGVRVLQQLGFSFERARACEVTAWDTIDGETFSTLASVDFSKSVQMFGSPGYTVHRVDLHNELLRLATGPSDGSVDGKPADLRLASRVVSATSDGTVVLEDGSTYTADLVVAADGLRSVLRDPVLGAETEIEPYHSGSAAFRFLVDTEVFKKDPVLAELLENKQGHATILVDTKDKLERHMIWYSCRGGEVQNFVGIHPSQADLIEEGEDAKSQMRKEFAHFHEHIARMFGLAQHVRCWPLLIQNPFPKWSRGRLVLIGDAAHPMLPFGGQGANMAIEDGGALGFLFADITNADQIGTRLSLYEKVRKNRASRVQILSGVRIHREQEVEAKVRQYAESSDILIPTSMRERTIHDYSYDLFSACEKILHAAAKE
ncbi:hypothetical protein F4818DRAFT_436326 [Hypoxylon cercidicola]|nr:hypothetical protein F4818DRAFT_436326 [Hypoxylon cercidicola]